MRPSDFDFELPPERIAEVPAEPRDSARMLVHRVLADQTEHRHARDLVEFLEPGDLLVLNDTRVLPARLLGRRPSGGQVELLLLAPSPELGARTWRALVRPSARVREGQRLELEGGALAARLLRRSVSEDAHGAEWEVEIESDEHASVEQLLERHGRMPVPPYIRRDPQDAVLAAADRERYQTVFAREPGAVAAPTAGLHLTQRLLAALEEKGVQRTFVTLHVGLGTFQPVATEDIAAHRMHSERFALPEEAASAVAATRARGGRVVAVGTTSLRVLESCRAPGRLVHPARGSTSIFLKPGDPIEVVDVLLTNFHLPRSTLLMLVSAIAGRERILRLYAEALARSYRFFSYGDAMLLLP